jgi:hypothetical protein
MAILSRPSARSVRAAGSFLAFKLEGGTMSYQYVISTGQFFQDGNLI